MTLLYLVASTATPTPPLLLLPLLLLILILLFFLLLLPLLLLLLLLLLLPPHQITTLRLVPHGDPSLVQTVDVEPCRGELLIRGLEKKYAQFSFIKRLKVLDIIITFLKPNCHFLLSPIFVKKHQKTNVSISMFLTFCLHNISLFLLTK